MKNLLYIISLCGLLTACDLQEEPYGFYSDDNFYKSETDAESGLLYAYNALTFLEYSRGIFYIGDIPTETMSPKSDEAGDVYQLENWIAPGSGRLRSDHKAGRGPLPSEALSAIAPPPSLSARARCRTYAPD